MLKKLVSNTVAQLIAKFFGAGLTLLTTYFTIRLAGLPLYGDLSKILVLVAIGFTLIDFGLNAEAIRRKNPVSTVIITRLLLSIFVLLISNLFIQSLGGGYSLEVKQVFWLGSLAIIFQGLYTSANAHFQATLSYWRGTLAVILGSVVGSALTLYFLVTAPTLFNLVLANTIGALTLGVSALLLLPSLSDIRYSISEIHHLLKSSLLLGLILIASTVASKVDTVLLGIFRTSSEVGAYSFAYRIFDVILVFPVYVMNAVYPLLLSPKNTSNLISKTLASLSLVGVVAGGVLWFCAPLVLYVKPELALAVPVLRILSLSTPLFYLTAPLMWQLISRQKDHLVLCVYLLAMLLNFFLNFIFIPSFGILAAATITGITELFIFLSLLYFSR